MLVLSMLVACLLLAVECGRARAWWWCPVLSGYAWLLAARIAAWPVSPHRVRVALSLSFLALQFLLVIEALLQTHVLDDPAESPRENRARRWSAFAFSLCCGLALAFSALYLGPHGPPGGLSQRQYLWHTSAHLVFAGAVLSNLGAVLVFGRWRYTTWRLVRQSAVLGLYFVASIIGDSPAHVLPARTQVNEALDLLCLLLWWANVRFGERAGAKRLQ